MKYPVVSLLFLLVSFVGLRAADLQRLVQETQRMFQEGNTFAMVWWIPPAFWEETLKDNPQLTAEQKREFVKVLSGYTAFSVSHSVSGPFGGMTYKSRDEILANSKLTVGGDVLSVLKSADLSADAASFYAMMKPMMGSMLGQFGEGMEFLVYSNTFDGKPVMDPSKAGEFEFTLFGETFKWRLPLGSMLPPMFDEETGEEFPGNYLFNPYTGGKLTARP